jgi:hypothetical protein
MGGISAPQTSELTLERTSLMARALLTLVRGQWGNDLGATLCWRVGRWLLMLVVVCGVVVFCVVAHMRYFTHFVE